VRVGWKKRYFLNAVILYAQYRTAICLDLAVCAEIMVALR